MPCLNIVGRGFFVFEKIVCGFDGIRAATELRNTPSRMHGHRLCDLFNARNTPDVRQLCPCKLFVRPLLWFWVYTNLHCLTPHLSLVKLLYVTMPQGEFWVMTSSQPWSRAPSLKQVLQCPCRTSTSLRGYPARQRHMKRQQFVHRPAMVRDPRRYGRRRLLGLGQTLMRRAKIIGCTHQEHPFVQCQGVTGQRPAAACQRREALPECRVESLNVCGI